MMELNKVLEVTPPPLHTLSFPATVQLIKVELDAPPYELPVRTQLFKVQ